MRVPPIRKNIMALPPAPSTADLPISLPFRTGALSARKPQRFDLAPAAEARALLAQLLGITAVYRMQFKGEIRAVGRGDFMLEGELTASVEQPCGITLAPVQTEISEKVERHYLAEMVLPDAAEVEIPGDEDAEPVPEVIDAGAVAAEALALALPLYPRAPGAELAEAVFAEPGVAAIRDADLKPFAGLAALRLTAGKPANSED
jgi:uncharacterized metal-binding protein YceD (DUF177 family)